MMSSNDNVLVLCVEDVKVLHKAGFSMKVKRLPRNKERRRIHNIVTFPNEDVCNSALTSLHMHSSQ